MLTREDIRNKYLEKVENNKIKGYITIVKESPSLLRKELDTANTFLKLINLLEKANNFFTKVSLSHTEKYPEDNNTIYFEIVGIDFMIGEIYWKSNKDIKTISELKNRVLKMKKEIKKWIEYWEEPICRFCPYVELLQ